MHSKKVGILTFNKSINYGSALQTWALSHYISKLGFDVSVIDYTPNNYEELYALLWKPTSLSKIKRDAIHIILLPFLLRRKKGFSEFSEHFLPLSEIKYKSGDDLSGFVDAQDIMICGSDLIWSTNSIDFNMDFFLSDYSSKKKVSYAPSIGNNKFDKSVYAEMIKRSLMKFDLLSVREQDGADFIEEFLDHQRKVETVLDPTLLLASDDYMGIMCREQISEPYIFFYSAWYTPSAVRAALDLSQRYGLSLFTLMPGRGNLSLVKNKAKIRFPRFDCGPSGFLSLIKNAKYVVTDSFHGTAFSIIFEKKFIAINDNKTDGSLANDCRIINLLSLVDLTSHYIQESDAHSFDLDQDIDYSAITRIRMKEAEKSKDYLKKALEI